MKNRIYYFGTAVTLTIILGCLFKSQHWPGAGILLTLGMVLLVFGFLPIALINSYKSENDKRNKLLYVLFFISFSITLLGALFKVQHWPGAYWLMVIGIPLPFVLFLPVYLIYNRTQTSADYNQLLSVLFFLAYFSVINTTLGIDVSTNVVNDLTLSAVNTKEQNKILHKRSLYIIESVLPAADSSRKKVLMALNIKAENLCKLVDSIERRLIVGASRNNKALITNNDIDIFRLEGKKLRGVGGDVFYDYGVGEKLTHDLRDYRQLVLSELKETSKNGTWIPVTTIPDNFQFDLEQNLIYTINYLELLKKKVIMAQYDVLSSMRI